MVKFYGAARAAGVKPIVGADCWLQNRPTATSRSASCCFAPRTRATCGCATCCRAPGCKNQHRGRGEIDREWLEKDNDGLIVLSGGAGRRHRPGAARRPCRGGRARSEALGGGISRPLLPGAAARRPAQHRGAGLALGGARDAAQAAGGRHPPGAVPRAGRLQGARGEGVHLAGLRARRPAAAEAVHAGAVLQDARRRWRSCSPTSRRRSQNSVEIARRCNLAIELGKSRLPAFPTPDGCRVDDYLRASEAARARLKKLRPRESNPLPRAARVRAQAPSSRWASPATS